MKLCLVDVNIWIALIVRHHEHQAIAMAWFDRLSMSEAGLCRIVQLAVIRLLANRSVMGEHVLAPAAAWTLLEELQSDQRVQFLAEPPGLDDVFPTLLHYPVPTPQLVMDAYLAAFAIASNRRLVTLDAGFRQFEGLELDVLVR